MYDKSVRNLLRVYGDNVEHVTPTVIVTMYQRIFGCLPEGCIEHPKCQSDDVMNLAQIIQYLQNDVLNIDLSHIDPVKVAHGDSISVEYLLEILAGYVEYILDADGPNSQNVSAVSDDEEIREPMVEMNRTFTPTKEILAESPIKSILASELSEVDSEIRNTSAFREGYQIGINTNLESDSDLYSGNLDESSLLHRLNKLPNISAALKKNGVDVPDFCSESVTSSIGMEKVPESPEEKFDDTDELLARSMSDIGDCVAQSTPFPTSQHRETSPVSTQTDFPARQNKFKTPEKKLDESIKSRLLYLLEQSGNTKTRKRQVRFDIPESPSDSRRKNHEYMVEKEKFEYELEKRILEEELKEKIDQLVLEKKKLRDMTIKKTTPKPPKKTPNKKTPGSKQKKPPQMKTPVLSPTHSPGVGVGGHQSAVIEDYLLPQMLESFPYLHVSPQTARVLWNKQVKQINALTQVDTNKTKLIKKHLEEEEKRQELLLNLMKKELEFVTRYNNEKAVKDEKRLLKAKLLEKKLTTARVRKYHQDYCKRTKARMCNKGYKEEVMFKQLFEKGMKIQKENLLESRKQTRERAELQKKVHEQNMKELEKYYVDQFELMSSELDKEQTQKGVRAAEKRGKLHKQKLEQRTKMSREIESLQDNLVRSDDHLHFKNLEFENALQQLC